MQRKWKILGLIALGLGSYGQARQYPTAWLFGFGSAVALWKLGAWQKLAAWFEAKPRPALEAPAGPVEQAPGPGEQSAPQSQPSAATVETGAEAKPDPSDGNKRRAMLALKGLGFGERESRAAVMRMSEAELSAPDLQSVVKRAIMLASE